MPRTAEPSRSSPSAASRRDDHRMATRSPPPPVAERDRSRSAEAVLGPTGRPMPDLPVPGPLTEPRQRHSSSPCATRRAASARPRPTINLGAALAEYGRKVLLVDFDPQASLTVGLGHQPQRPRHDDLPPDDGARHRRSTRRSSRPASTGLDLLPSNIDFAGAEMQLINEVAREQVLARALEPAIDDVRRHPDRLPAVARPAHGQRAAASTASSSRWSASTSRCAASRCSRAPSTRCRSGSTPSSQIVGLLGTMYDGRTLHSREVLQTLVDGWGDAVFHTVIRRTVKFSEATVAGEPLLAYATDSRGRRLLPPARPGGAGQMSRRVKLPGRGRAVPPDQVRATGRSRERPPAATRCRADADRRRRRRRRQTANEGRSGRVRHDEKITVYVTADELLDLEHTRLTLRRDHGLAVDRGRIVREAIHLALGGVEARRRRQRPRPAAARAVNADRLTRSIPRAARRGFAVHLDNFEGPFDLLLQLISKHQLDITEVALSRVTDEFIAHIKALGAEWDLEQTTQFLVVAATLLDLKIVRLLPSADVEDEEDLALLEARDLLFARLMQYRAFKQVAAIFEQRLAEEARRVPRSVGLDERFASVLPEVLITLGPEEFAALAARGARARSPSRCSAWPTCTRRRSASASRRDDRRAAAATRTMTFRALVADSPTR